MRHRVRSVQWGRVQWARLTVVVAAVLSFVAFVPFDAPGASAAATSGSVMKDGVAVQISPLSVRVGLIVTFTLQVECANVGNGSFVLDGLQADLLQANGKRVSSASGGFDAEADAGQNPILVCDGSTVNSFHFKMLPDTGSTSFKAGPAVLSLRVAHETTSGGDLRDIGPRVVQLVARS
jgi:hypothetical protein